MVCAQLQGPYSSAESVKRAIFVPRTTFVVGEERNGRKWPELRGFPGELNQRKHAPTRSPLTGTSARYEIRGWPIAVRDRRAGGYAGRAFTFKPPSRMIFDPLK